MALAWVVLAVLLLLVEVRHFAFYALFGAAGALAAAGVAVVWPDLVAVQIIVAAVVGVVGIRAVRPLVSDSFHARPDGRVGRGVHGSLVGEEVLTLDTVTGHHVGHVFLAGERWLAISGSGDAIPTGTRVLVTGVEGTRLIVWPVGGHLPLLDLGDPADLGAVGDPCSPEPERGSEESSRPTGDLHADPAREREQGEQQ